MALSSVTGGFESSLKPFIILLNLFGFSIPEGKFRSFLFPFGGLLWFSTASFLLFSLIVTIRVASYLLACSPTCVPLLPAEIFTMSSSFSSLVVFIFLNHSSFFVVNWLVPAEWTRLWLDLHEIQRDLGLEIQFHCRIRNIVRIALFVLFVDASFFFYPISFEKSMWFWDLDSLYPMFIVMINLSRLIASAVVTLLIVLILVGAELFALLNRRANCLIQHYKNGEMSDFLLVNRLENWRNHHILVCQFTRRINTVFNPIILTSVCYYFISFILYSYAVIETFRRQMGDVKFYLLGMFIQHLIGIFFTMYAPSKLQTQVIIIQ